MGPPEKRHWIAFPWRADGGSTLYAGWEVM